MPEEVGRPPPKAFISYRWSSPEHEEWVLALAVSLRSDGVEVILDKWHLREGQDTLAFMESMVTDDTIRKVLLICDKGYVERANNREGGVGTEAQIVSPKVYESTTQEKFAAIVVNLNEDGKPFLPRYMESRLYFDMSTREAEVANYESVVRWIFGKPFHVAPEIGRRPAFLDESYSISSGLFRSGQRLERAALGGSIDTFAAASSLLETVESELSSLKLKLTGEQLPDEIVFDRIRQTFTLKEQYYKAFLAIIRSSDPRAADAIHLFFEKIVLNWDNTPLNERYTRWDDDVIHFFGHLCLIGFVGIAMRERAFGLAADVLSMPIFKPRRLSHTGELESYTTLRSYLESLDSRNARLALNRISLHADLFQEAHEHSVLSFINFMEADITLFVRGLIAPKYEWYPVSALYLAGDVGSLPTYVRATSAKFYDRFRPLLLERNPTSLRSALANYLSPEFQGRLRFDYRTLPLERLINLENLGSSA